MKTKTAAELGIKRLYHYQAFNNPERLARIFTDGTIYFSSPKDFNDPWDCRPYYSKSALNDSVEYELTVRWFVHLDRAKNTSLSEAEHLSREQEIRANRNLLEWMIDQMTSEMEQAIQTKYRVYCSSTHSDSTLMWSHYAASCKGLCLEFSVQNDLFDGALPIEYLDNYLSFSVSGDDEDENIRPLLTKSAVWSYEQEYRVVASEKPYVFDNVPTTINGFHALPQGALQSVIVGALMPESDRELVRRLVNMSGWNVALKEASLVPNRYEFKIKPLD